MKLEQYLHQKYGQHSVGLTKAESRQFGVPYPLIHGWEKRHAKLEITPEMARRVIQIFQNPTASAGKQSLRERALLILSNIVNAAGGIDAMLAEQDAHIRDLAKAGMSTTPQIQDADDAWDEGLLGREDKFAQVADHIDISALKVSKSGKVPEGDVRLTANIRKDLHVKLKIAAVMRSTTIGALIEEMVAESL